MKQTIVHVSIKWKQIGSFETNLDGSDIERKGEKKYNYSKQRDYFG